MKRLYRATGFAIALGVASLAGGCVPPQTTITSSSDKSYVKEPKRIMAVETVGDELGQYHATFKATLAQRLQGMWGNRRLHDAAACGSAGARRLAAVVQRQQEQVAIRQMSAETVLEIVQVSVYRTQEIPPIVRESAIGCNSMMFRPASRFGVVTLSYLRPSIWSRYMMPAPPSPTI